MGQVVVKCFAFNFSLLLFARASDFICFVDLACPSCLFRKTFRLVLSVLCVCRRLVRCNAATLRPFVKLGILRLLGSCPWRVIAMGRREERQRREREQESEGRGEKRRREDRGAEEGREEVRRREGEEEEEERRRGRGRRPMNPT